jgi:ElaB/YqjD/DUF883 family membrane-anchored ribosome-binding protein
MKNGELERLEREVEQARDRVVADISRLRSRGNMAELKRDISSEIRWTKDRLVQNGTDAVRDRAESLMDAIKARVAANPAAALAVGAGLAWRFYRHPPIAPLLIGAGLTALFRTDPRYPAVGADMAARAVDMAGSARARAREWSESERADEMREFAADAKTRVGEFATDAREQATEFAEAARERVGEFADTARELAETAGDRVGEFADAARERLSALRATTGERAGQGARYASRTAESWKRNGQALYGAARNPENRDSLLLGAAALAVAAAVGIAAQRRHSADGPHAAEDGVDHRTRRNGVQKKATKSK